MAGAWKSYRNKPKKRRFYKRKGFWIGSASTCIILAIIALLAWNFFTKEYRERAAKYDLEKINELEIPSIILDRDGQEIGRIFVENRSLIQFGDIPPNFINALKAGEDSRFDDHKGVDYIGVGRASWNAIKNLGKVNQGASTITQQLARDAYGLKAEAVQRQESGFKRKLVEMFLAQRIEEKYRKDEILTFFVNRSFLGSGYYGLRSAALGYYGKEPHELSIPECASIVAILRNPREISPLKNSESNKKGRDHVLWRMSEEKMISQEEYQTFRNTPITLNPKPLQRGTSHVYEIIANEARESITEDAFAKGGFTIHTTLIKSVQENAQTSIKKHLTNIESRQDYTLPTYAAHKSGTPAYLQGALMVMDHQNGDVLAYIGGRDYTHSQYDFIREGKKPLGTAFTPFLAAAALTNNFTPATLLEDEPMDNRTVMVGGNQGILGEWGQETATPSFQGGKITMRRAFQDGKISAIIRLGNLATVQRTADAASLFGIKIPDEEKLPRMFVGWQPIDLTTALMATATIPRGGTLPPLKPVFVTRIQDSNNVLVWQRIRTTDDTHSAMDSASAYQIHQMMRGISKDGNLKDTLNDMPKTFHGAVKTGTTHDFTNTWAIGYSAHVTCVTWNGCLQSGKPIYEGAFGKDISLPIWKDVMKSLPLPYLAGSFQKPNNIIEQKICTVSGQIAGDYCYQSTTDPHTGLPQLRDARITEYFRSGTEKIPSCSLHSAGNTGIPEKNATSTNSVILNAVAIRPKKPLLIGTDPYKSEMPNFNTDNANQAEEGTYFQTNDQIMDMINLGDDKALLPLEKPSKLDIKIE